MHLEVIDQSKCVGKAARARTHDAPRPCVMGGRWRRAASAALAALACRGAGAASTAPAVLREQRVYPGGGPGGDASLAPGWSNFSWRGSYDLNSTAVAPFRGTACAQALPQLYGALSFYTRTPFFGTRPPASASCATREQCAMHARGASASDN